MARNHLQNHNRPFLHPGRGVSGEVRRTEIPAVSVGETIQVRRRRL